MQRYFLLTKVVSRMYVWFNVYFPVSTVFRHSFPHFMTNFQDISYCVAKLDIALFLSEPRAGNYKKNIIFSGKRTHDRYAIVLNLIVKTLSHSIKVS